MNNLIDLTNLDEFLDLSPDFKILDEAQIIFAPNGTGKTTLFTHLKKSKSSICDFYSYDPSADSTYKQINSANKSFVIDPLPTNYSTELQKKENEKETLDCKNAIKLVFNQTEAQIKRTCSDPDIIKTVEEKVLTFYAPLNNIQRDKLKFIINFDNDLNYIISRRKELHSISEEQKKADIETLKILDRKNIYNCYIVEDHKEDIEKDGCPLCGNKEEGVYEKILNIRNKINSLKFLFFENFDFLKNLPDKVDPLTAINDTIEGILSLTEKELVFLLVSKGKSENEKNLLSSINNYSAANNNIKKYIAERDEAYNLMSNSKSTIEKYFPMFYPKSTVAFDDTKKTVKISTPRAFKSYSEGEKHEMYSTIRELAIIGSDKEIVIADDPLTELDTANEYKNVFRFVSLANENNKKVIIFTCNPNFINIANEYHPNLFKKFYLSSRQNLSNNKLELKLLEMDFPNNNGQGPYISLSQLISNHNNCNNSNLNFKVAQLINERAIMELSYSVSNNRKKDISSVLHYDCQKKIAVSQNTSDIICNDDLVNIIDSFVSLSQYNSFTELILDRVCYLAALRVYIERKIFDYQNERKAKNLPDCFNGKPIHLTKDKINAVNSINDSFKITDKYKNWNKSSLMRLKTMLNDNDHPYSYILPVSFAMSIGDDTLTNEINTIKDLFSM